MIISSLPDETGLSLGRLITFCKIAEAGGISKAAEGDANCQSQYSRQLKQLEQYFEADLLIRGSGGTLTEAGQRLLIVVKPLLNGLGSVARDLKSKIPSIFVGGGEGAITWWLMPLLAPIGAKIGRVDWHLTNLRTDDIVAGLVGGQLDLGLLRRDACTDELTCRPAFKMEFSLCVPRGLLNTGRVPAAALAGRGKLAAQMLEVARQQKRVFETVIYCDSLVQIKSTVATGRFAGVLPSVAAATLDDTKFLVTPLRGSKAPMRDYVIAYTSRIVRLKPILERIIGELAPAAVTP